MHMHIREKEEKEIPLCLEEKGILQEFSVYTSQYLSARSLHALPCACYSALSLTRMGPIRCARVAPLPPLII